MPEREIDRYFRKLPKINKKRLTELRTSVSRGLHIDDLEGDVTQKRILVTDLAQTIYFAAQFFGLKDPQVRLGTGVLVGKLNYLAYTDHTKPEPHIVFALSYIRAQIDNAVSDDTLPFVVHSPIVIAAHELRHASQFVTNPTQLTRDLHDANYDPDRWNSTTSELDARSFGIDFANQLSRRRPLR